MSTAETVQRCQSCGKSVKFKFDITYCPHCLRTYVRIGDVWELVRRTTDKEQGEAMKNLDFGEAVRLLKRGKKVRRAEWMNWRKCVILEREIFGTHEKIRNVRNYFSSLDNLGGELKSIPDWMPSVDDIIATDWEVVE